MTLVGQMLLPVLAHAGLVFFLYAWLTVARMRAVKSGKTKFSCFVLGRDEPIEVARITRNLANQFELPIIFYLMVILLIGTTAVTQWDVIAGWVFVVGRLLHTYVQTHTDNVKLRGQVFLINFLAVIFLTAHMAWLMIPHVTP